MAAQVVCISRTDGALGESVGNLVAERLGFRYVDEQVIERAARLAQVDPGLVAAVEQRQRLLHRVIGKLAAARDLVGPGALAFGAPMAAVLPERGAPRITPEDLRVLIQAAIHEIAREGSAVIVAHAASLTLATRPDVVRVLVTASSTTRALRVAEARGVAFDAATAAVTDGDRNRRDYLRRFHNVAEEQPTHYDIVINTDVLTPEQAADVVAYAAGRAGGGPI